MSNEKQETFWTVLLNENWPLLALFALLMVGGLVGYMFSSGDEDGRENGVAAAEQKPFTERVPHARPANEPRPTPEEKVRETIESHREKIQRNPEAEKSPAYLSAMGNLYMRKLRDYRSAIDCYEILLMDYPDWDLISSVYIHLAECYEKLGDIDHMKDTYHRMMEKFPEDSVEYEFAVSLLGRGWE